MGITIIIGGQFGSEGKGKVAHWYANRVNASAVIRVGGPNSGHTVVDNYSKINIFRILPTAAIDNSRKCILPAGSYIDVKLLQEEIKQSRINPKNVLIDPNAVIVTKKHIYSEATGSLVSSIGSTASGIGAAVSMRVNRASDLLFAKDVPFLSNFLCNTTEYLRNELNNGQEIVIEGTQGFGLSNIHTPYYPYATCRDTTAAGFLSEAGLSPLDVNNVIMVIRAFPIRVGGNSGPLPAEISWDDVTSGANCNNPIREYTSVTKHLRRVANFDPQIVKMAISANKPNIIVMNHLDYIGEPGGEAIGPKRRLFLKNIEAGIGQKIDYVGLDNRCVLPFRAEIGCGDNIVKTIRRMNSVILNSCLKEEFDSAAYMKVYRAPGLFRKAVSQFKRFPKCQNQIDMIDEVWFFFDIEEPAHQHCDARLKPIQWIRKLPKARGIRIWLLMTTAPICAATIQ